MYISEKGNVTSSPKINGFRNCAEEKKIENKLMNMKQEEINPGYKNLKKNQICIYYIDNVY